ncbi:MAG: histidine--tRNA ligase [Puniceicoccales bacterium]|jgi:histidyl-tRNA synthetase|nr:histidine--tRNA ligase [Puniceicoccales bacterium]
MRPALPGFREFYPPECALRNAIFATFRRVVRRFGFEEFDGPTLEPLELFTDKSGPEIASQLFHFADRGGRAVALRPEMTPTLARMVGARAAGLRRPIRWSNVGEAFRYERPQKGRLRSFYQMNADLLGEEDAAADGELVVLLLSILEEFGLTVNDFYLRVSDRQLWSLFLGSFGLADSAIGQVLSAIDKVEREGEEETKKKLGEIFHGNVAQLWAGIAALRSCNGTDDLRKFFSSTSLREATEKRLTDWDRLLECVASAGFSAHVAVDMTVVRGLAYYTGFVFEAFERGEKGRALAGGGRYDDLVEKLSGTPLAATGFAIGDVTLANLLVEKGLISDTSQQPIAFVLMEDAVRQAGLALVHGLRKKDLSVLWDLADNRSLARQMGRADRSGAAFALSIGVEEVAGDFVTVRSMASGAVERVARAEVGDWLARHGAVRLSPSLPSSSSS